MHYAITVTVPISYEDAVKRTREALAEQGFGVLTEIDVRATFETKLGVESSEAVGDYVILGACNPPLAERAIAADPNIGLLLPCNVVIRRGPDASSTTVQAANPQAMVELSGVPAMQSVADEAGRRLRAALDALESSSQQ